MKLSFLTIVPALIAVSGPVAAQGQEQVVEVRGSAAIQSSLPAARQAALADAIREAVEQVLGAYISSSASLRSQEAIQNDSSVESTEQFQQRILKRADGYGRVLRVVSESQNSDTFQITVQVAVSRGPLEQQVKAFLARKGDPRIMVLIPEEIIRNPVPDPAAETEVMRALIQGGYRVVDVRQTERLLTRDQLRHGNLDAQALREMGTRFQADLLITGEAFAEELPTMPEAIRGSGMQAYNARLEVKIIDLATAQVIYSGAFHAGGIGATDGIAGKTALANAALKATPELPRTILTWLSGQGQGAGRTFTIKITALPNFRAVTDFTAALRATAGISSVSQRHFDQGGAVIEVEYEGSPEELAALLEDFNLTVTGLSAGEITASYSR